MEGKNRIRLPDVSGTDEETQKYFENVRKAEGLINDYINDNNSGKILHDSCSWIPIEDYVKLYSKNNGKCNDELFEAAADMKDSPLERALYLASTQGVTFEKGSQEFAVSYENGVHSEYRNFRLWRVWE